MTIIKTFTGYLIDIENPDTDAIDIRDIAHALSFICRGSGQVRTFFSVARHSVFCAREAKARGYSDAVAMACLLHDASEAYMADVPHPIKENLIPEYRVYEDRLLDMVFRKYIGRSLTAEEAAVVECIDRDLLQYDLKYLLNMDIDLPEVHTVICYDFIPFAESEREYLEMFYSMSSFN